MKILTKILGLTALVLLTATSAFAGGGTTYYKYYSRMITTPTGKGTVYTSTTPTEEPAYTNLNSIATQGGNDVEGESETHTYHLYAQPIDGYAFTGWYTDNGCTDLFSLEHYISYQIEATSQNESEPTEAHFWAKFEEVVITYYSHMTVQSMGNGSVAVSSSKVAPAYKEETDEATQGINSVRHTYYLFAKPNDGYTFEGWYSDAECTKLISNSASCSYTFSTDATEAESAAEGEAYAKFVVNNNIYTIENGDFEQWEDVTNGEEPVKWSSFLTLRGSGFIANTARSKQLESSTDAHSGSKCAKMWARSVVGVTAQGNLTTGCINAGSMTASDASGNYNFTNEENPDQAMRFTGRPDAIRVWIKSNISGKAKIAAILHEKGYYQDPLIADRITGDLVAQATASPENTSGQWKEYIVPFKYETGKNRPYYALISFATSDTPGGGSASDEMWIDDVEMLYYSEIKQATFNGQNISFDGEGQAEVAGTYDPTKLAITLNGVGAIMTSDYDEASAVLTITVEADNISVDATNFHTYTIHFTGGDNPGPGPDITDPYVLNFEEDTPVGRTDRQLNSISLIEGYSAPKVYYVDPGYIYNDLTLDPFEVEVGASIKPMFDYDGTWMNGYVYIDMDNNGVFDVDLDAGNFLAGGDLVAYSFYSFSSDDREGYNSNGTKISGEDRGQALDTPAFAVPAKQGTYRMRFIIDWNSIDPAGSLGSEGSIDGKNGIRTNGGYITDITLHVVDPSLVGISSVNANASAHYFDLQGRALTRQPKSGLYIQNCKKVIK